jgi:hypothetical protein
VTWPAVLASKLDLVYKCHARPCAGNLEILENILNEAQTSNGIYLICWTFIDRFSVYEKGSIAPSWKTILPTDSNKVSDIYYKQIHSEYADKLVNLLYIKLAIQMLNEKNIPFVMICMDPLLFDSKWYVSPAIDKLQADIIPYITWFEGKTFLQWSQDQNYPISPGWHPLEQAHLAAADYLIDLVNQKKLQAKETQ